MLEDTKSVYWYETFLDKLATENRKLKFENTIYNVEK